MLNTRKRLAVAPAARAPLVCQQTPVSLHQPQATVAACAVSSVCRMLRPTGRRIFELFLAAIWRCIEQHARIAVMLGAARVRRIGVQHVVAEPEEDAQSVLLAEEIVRTVVRFILGLAAI